MEQQLCHRQASQTTTQRHCQLDEEYLNVQTAMRHSIISVKSLCDRAAPAPLGFRRGTEPCRADTGSTWAGGQRHIPAALQLGTELSLPSRAPRYFFIDKETQANKKSRKSSGLQDPSPSRARAIPVAVTQHRLRACRSSPRPGRRFPLAQPGAAAPLPARASLPEPGAARGAGAGPRLPG